MEIVVSDLKTSHLEAPLAGEREPIYTARCLQPRVRSVLADLGINGLVEGGEGAGRARPVVMLGLRFYPDLTVTYHGSKAIAFEVKFARAANRENSLATALGQAYLYRQAGYRQSGAFVIDDSAVVTEYEIRQAESVCRSAGLELVVRRRKGLLLDQHPR